jgi:hypothetical protein
MLIGGFHQRPFRILELSKLMTLTLLLRGTCLASCKNPQQHNGDVPASLSPSSHSKQFVQTSTPPPPPQCKQQVYKGSDNTKTMKTWTLLCNDRVMKRAINLPRFALAKQQLTVLRPRKQSKRGTGVFLPRAEAYN